MRNPTYFVRTGAGGDPDAAAIPVVKDDKAPKVTWDLAKFLYFWSQTHEYINKTSRYTGC